MKHITLILLLSGFSLLNAYSVSASVIHKWVDENGVTHYSNVAPETNGKVSRVELELQKPTSRQQSSDYYSIKNEWARVNQQRLENEKIRQQTLLLSQLHKPKKAQVEYKKPTVQKRKKSRTQSRRHRHSIYSGIGSHRKSLLAKKRFFRHKLKRKLVTIKR